MEHVPAAAAPARPRLPARLLRVASDERLVALVRRGDESAFEALYDRHQRAILGFCRHMLGSREEAEDAVQQTFLAAYRDLVGSAKPIELRPWLFAIARNRCRSTLRARREHAPLERAEPSTDGLAATVERREDLRELLGDVARLPEDQRAALLLAELGALDHAGIAAVLGCPREKVRALVFQARSSLLASRDARATPCREIRAELASASGAALRRGPLRRHLRDCPGCRAFRDEVAAQRKLLGLALPVVPTAALKASVLSGAGGALGGASLAGGLGAAGTSGALGAGGTSGALGGALGTALSAGTAKVAVSLTLASAVAGGGVALHDRDRPTRSSAAAPAQTVTEAVTRAGRAPALPTSAPAAPPAGAAPRVAGTGPPRSAGAQGVLPQRAGGTANRAIGREHAAARSGDAPGAAAPGRAVPPPRSRRPDAPPSGAAPPQARGPAGAAKPPSAGARQPGPPPWAPAESGRGPPAEPPRGAPAAPPRGPPG